MAAVDLSSVPVPARAERTALREVDGHQLVAALESALAWLQANQEAVNDLNVFPVPDGDTGTNMCLTLRSAVDEARRAVAPMSAASVLVAAAHGSLMGARGNSGVILSQVFRGFSQAVGSKTVIDPSLIADGLTSAAVVAYQAVMKPTEGTILTVVRDSAAAATGAAATGADVFDVLRAAVREAHAAVDRTPEQLAVLREAEVVDAGGFGFAVILEGLIRGLSDTDPAPAPDQPRHRAGGPRVRLSGTNDGELAGPDPGPMAIPLPEEGWGYCTEFLIHGPGLDLEMLRAEFAESGESALVVGDGDLIRVHIHTRDPAPLIHLAARRGRLSRLKVEDMSTQHHAILERPGAERMTSPRRRLGVVSVAVGHGFRAILGSLGSDVVVEGGQTMNPSIEDLLTAVRSVDADEVLLLPNNPNVVLTADQVDALVDNVAVTVIPTQNLPQGICALLVLDPAAAADRNAERMRATIKSVRAVEVTQAVRDTVTNGLRIRAGDIIAVLDGELIQAGDSILEVIDAVLAPLADSSQLVTVYSGAGVAEAEAATLVAELHRRHPHMELQLHSGGQDHYPYVLSIE